MNMTTLCKTSVALACALSFSAHAVDIKDAALMAKANSSDNIHILLGLNKGANQAKSQFKASKQVALGNGNTKSRYQQFYHNIPVFGYSVAATQTTMGQLFDVKGDIVDLSQSKLSTKPLISAEKAMQTRLKADKKLSLKTFASAKVYNQQNQLFVYLHKDKPKLVHRISYVVPAVDGGTPSRPVYFVDANNGEVLHAYENLQHVKLGEGPGGNSKVGCYEYGTNFDYLDISVDGANYVMNNPNVKTINLNHGTSGGEVYSFLAPRNDVKAINGGCGPLNDAHFFGGTVFDMYQAYVGTPPLNFQLTMRVHYGNNYENAFWDGSSMTFGDGGNNFYPLVSLDVAAHEVSHGFTEQNSGLIYQGQSGGINEAFSDMAGEAAEYFLYGNNDFLVGEQVYKSAGALRYMENPPQDGQSIDNINDYTDGLDVHYSSGIFNKAFSTLAQKPDCNTGKAFEVFALASQAYWQPNSDFHSAACSVESAAYDKGYNGYDVTDAFAEVGIYCSVCLKCLPINELYKDQPITVSGGVSSQQEFYYHVPEGANSVKFNISGGSGDADLYVKFGQVPTTTSWECRPYTAGNNENCTIDNPQAGTYHAMLYGYNAFSNVTLVANHSIGPANSGTVTDIDLARGEMKLWEVFVPSNVKLFEVSINGGTGDADLYLRRGQAPTLSTYDCRHYISGSNETCRVTNPTADTYHIGVRGYVASSGVTMTWQY